MNWDLWRWWAKTIEKRALRPRKNFFRGLIFSAAFIFCLRRHTFCQQQQKVCKKCRQRPMVSGLPLPSRVLFVMVRKGNRLSNRPATAPTLVKGRVGLPQGTDSHNQSADCLHRRVSRFPATLWHGKRDTSSKPPCCIRHRQRFGGFLAMTLQESIDFIGATEGSSIR